MNTTDTTAHEYGYIRGNEIYLKGFLDFPDRQIGQVKESEEASIKYFEKRFDLAKKKVQDLETMIDEAQNKGSYLMKLVHMRKYLAQFDGLGDYVALFKKLDELEAELRELIAVNRIKNLEIKRALIRETHDILEDVQDWNDATELIREVKLKWIKTGAVKKDFQESIEEDFNEMVRVFFDKRKDFYKSRNNEVKDRVRMYRDIVYRVEKMKDSDRFDETFEQFRDLQQRWKTIGKIPHKRAVEMWDKFKKSNDYFFKRYKSYKALREEHAEDEAPTEEFRDMIVRKMCVKAEDLLEDPDIDSSADQAKELLMSWKRISGIFKGIDRHMSSQFRNACDRIFEIKYLMRVIKRKYPYFDDKPREDQLRIKISFMRELIRRDEHDVQFAESKLSQSQSQYDNRGGGYNNNRYDNRGGGDRYNNNRGGGGGYNKYDNRDKYDNRGGGDRYNNNRGGGDRYNKYDNRGGGGYNKYDNRDKYDNRGGGDRYNKYDNRDKYDNRGGGDRYNKYDNRDKYDNRGGGDRYNKYDNRGGGGSYNNNRYDNRGGGDRYNNNRGGGGGYNKYDNRGGGDRYNNNRGYQDKDERQLRNTLAIQKRKIEVKKQILAEMEAELADLMN
ncbi:DUF349 domain-containing protein [Microscilla marina]|nr:DUF349 domain-containing protein [Microscilla marina]